MVSLLLICGPRLLSCPHPSSDTPTSLTRLLERREVPEVTEVAVAAEVAVVASEVATEATAPSAEKVVTAERVVIAEKVVTAEVAAVASEAAVEAAEVVPVLRVMLLPLLPLKNDLLRSDATITISKVVIASKEVKFQ